jgi:2-C-methyl-D-erythritol 2,4-cyclodiphosphate synthase/2-C-methyl-D-erythritol 4-phosphate cytidylyltransferase/2-C-methyl-D-erythritol 2,4-cyclodiphosphate synthase
VAFRVGLGLDRHPLVPGRSFLAGGVLIPAGCGGAGHSDGDALCHAVIDAVLGAACLGDIGEFFPDTDERWHGARSLDLLDNAWNRVREAGWRAVNLDCVVVCEKPAILPFRDAIRRSLGSALGLDAGAVFVKGKTGNGSVGDAAAQIEAGSQIEAGAQVEAVAICLLEKP